VGQLNPFFKVYLIKIKSGESFEISFLRFFFAAKIVCEANEKNLQRIFRTDEKDNSGNSNFIFAEFCFSSGNTTETFVASRICQNAL